MKNNIITITGMSCSGKTTLVNRLSTELNCPVIPEIITDLRVDVKRLYEEDYGKKMYTKMLQKQYDNITQGCNNNDLVISDRCYLDMPIYAKMQIKDKPWVREFTNDCKALDLFHNSKYNDMTFKLDPLPWKNNNVRFTKDYGGEMRAFQDLSKTWKNRTINNIPEQDLELRVKRVLNSINLYN